jgi:putative DNA primase/helicase
MTVPHILYEVPVAKICNAPNAAPSTVELICAASVKPESIRWLWPGWLARGKPHVLAGAPGTGKTTIAIDFAACVSAGRALPSGWRPQRGNVLIWSGEDDPADTLVPRLIAAGADLSRIQFVGEVLEHGQHYSFDPARDVPKLAAAAVSVENLALLIVDPLVSAVSGDSHKNAEVRRGLQPLVDFAAARDAALLGITHYSKGTQGREPLERVTGSLAFGALARIVYGTVRQESEGDDAPRKMMLARAKSNIGPDGGGFTYAFEQTELAEHGGLSASRIVWGAAVEGTARELLAEAEPEDDDRSESGECADWLREELKPGERDAATMKREGAKMGYTSKIIRRAREKLGVKPRKDSFDKGWVWALPVREDAQSAVEGAQDAQQNRVGTFGGNGHLRGNPDGSEPPSAGVEGTNL